MSKIALSEPSFQGNEWKYVKECIDTEWVSSAGKYVDKFESRISEFTGSRFGIGCVNGTSALQISLEIAGVKPEDEVIVPTLSFIAPINAIIYNNAEPIFMDVDQYYNIDVEKTLNFLKNNTFFSGGHTYNKKTKKRIFAILPVHIWGNAANMDDIINISQEFNLAIIEDASESLGTFFIDGSHQGSHTGTIGDLGCISFNGNKIITSGGGGMILTNNEDFALKAKYLTTQAKDDPINYVHNEVGYNFRLTNLLAALGVAQLEQLPDFLKRKKEINQIYKSKIDKIKGLSIASSPKYSSNNFWLNILQISKSQFKLSPNKLMKKLEENHIQSRPVWRLNHLQLPFKDFQTYEINNAYDLIEKSLCLPSSSKLSNHEIDSVVKVLNE